jgi:hypothetical protein
MAGLSDEKASQIMIGLREGRTPRTIRATAAQVISYCAAHTEYAPEALPMLAANIKAAQYRKGGPQRAKTQCINGHSLAENGRVAISCGFNTRQCRACELMRCRRGGVMKAGVLEKVTAHIIAGSPLRSFTAAGKQGYLLRFETLAR